MRWIFAFILISVAASVHAADAEPAGAREFVNQVIAYELRSDTTMRDEAFLAFFTPRFRAAIVKDMAGPELNVIDTDFLCESQTGEVKIRILAIAGSENTAAVRIKSWPFGVSPPTTLTWHLRRDGQEWLISDVETARRPSLLADLERSNRLH
jgi:hypothetical protein